MSTLKILFAILFIAASVSFSQPKLSLDKADLDIGTVYSGARKKGKISLVNIGTDTLRILSVHTSCGCTTVKQPKPFLLHNESDIIEVEFHASSFPGKINKTISIETNDPASRFTTVKLIGEIKQELQQLNPQIFLNVKMGKVEVIDIPLKNVSEHRIKIISFKTSSPSLTAKIDKNMIDKDDTLKAQVTLTVNKNGYNNEYLTIETDSKLQPSIMIQIQFMGIKEK